MVLLVRCRFPYKVIISRTKLLNRLFQGLHILGASRLAEGTELDGMIH